MKTYELLKTITPAGAVKALKGAYTRFTDAGVAQLEAMRELGALVFRIETHGDAVKFGFTNDKGVALSGKKMTDARAKWYAEETGITDTNFLSDARARGISMSVWAKAEAIMSREMFKAIAPIFRDKSIGSYADRAKAADAVMAKAAKTATKAGEPLLARHITAARNAKKRGTRGTKLKPADTLVEAATAIVEAVKAVRSLVELSENDIELLTEAHSALGRKLENIKTELATIAEALATDAHAG